MRRAGSAGHMDLKLPSFECTDGADPALDRFDRIKNMPNCDFISFHRQEQSTAGLTDQIILI